MFALANFLSLQTCGAGQTHLIRINRTCLTLPTIPCYGNSCPSVNSPSLCALCVKFLIFCHKSVSRNPSAGAPSNSRRMCTYDFAKPNPLVMNTCVKILGGGYSPTLRNMWTRSHRIARQVPFPLHRAWPHPLPLRLTERPRLHTCAISTHGSQCSPACNSSRMRTYTKEGEGGPPRTLICCSPLTLALRLQSGAGRRMLPTRPHGQGEST